MLAEVVRRAGAEFGDRVALVSPGDWEFTYRQLDQASDEAAVWLARNLAVDESTVAALVLPSTVDYLVLYVAFAKLGAVTAGVNPHLTARERAAALDCAQADVVVVDPAMIDGVPATARVVEYAPADHAEAVVASMRDKDEAPPVLPVDPLRPVAICFTSGSTGAPKGALFRDVQLRAIAQLDTAGVATWGQGTRSILGTQFAHVGGMTKIPWMLASGGTLQVLRKWRAQDVLRLTARYRMPTLNCGPAQIALMLRQPDFDQYDLSSVKAIIAGTGPSSPALIVEARERFHCGYSVRYSSTECGGVGLSTALDAPDDEALYTVGRPRPGIDAKIADRDGRELPIGETGEVWLRSPAVMSEYWRNPAETSATLVDGWLRTGDLGTKDDRGCYRLSGRVKEMFIRGGYNIYPLEVESVLCTHHKVAEIAVVPRPDDVMGEIGVAVVVPRDPADPPTLDELRTHGERGLARFKLPERLRIVDHMPLNATDKLDRRALAAIDRERARDD
jgi:acyl-CoA synthetase (AMP-forming)/AMP-acid ligase II